MGTSTYHQKRNQEKTPEPDGNSQPLSKNAFVIQEHDASSLHYDLRLRVGETLKSWAVPKGPSMDPSKKRLAIRTEDHPLDYAHFEGVIPKDQYGGGTVSIWDRGTYENLTEKENGTKSATEAIDAGHFLFRLDGNKLKGGWALQKISQDESENWLLIKLDDDQADARRNPVTTQTKSVKSGRTIREIAEDHDPD